MVWQDAISPSGGPNFDAEDERERRLAAQARAGAEWALTALIARYQPTVVRYLTRLCGNQALARTLAERIFQRMERRLHGPHGAEHLRLWLLRASTEAGLDALRRPQTAPMPRLGSGGVAGLLAEVSGKDAPALLQQGIRRLRKAAGGASRQANPLVWNEGATRNEAGETSAPGAKESHLDETLDHLDPREALRHRLVRVTLAEMPYGDAQCLALHLVAGLNQAEVAKALGITNSAARKRMVHGLAIFSERYAQAVQSLGLPVELGFGDAIPRVPTPPEPVAEPTPPPVIISSRASEPLPIPPVAPIPPIPPVAPVAPVVPVAQAVSGEDHVIAPNPTMEHGADTLSGVMYVSDDSGPMPSVTPRVTRDAFAPPVVGHETPNEPPYATPFDQANVGDETEATGAFDTATYTQGPVAVAVEESDALAPEVDAPLAESKPAPVSGALITRVAADAIIGPIVDALPVIPASPAPQDEMGLAAARSMPLAFELSSNTAQEAAHVTMNWHDDTGLMTPLGFEAVAIAADTSAMSYEPDDADAPLSLELMPTSADEPLAFAPTAEPAWAEDAEPVELTPEPVATPITVPVLTEPSDAPHHAVEGAAPAVEETPTGGLIAPREERGVITRSLEALWDELSEGADL